MGAPILLIGGGGHCKSCIDVIELDGRFSIAGIVDRPQKVNMSVLGYPVIGADDDLPGLIVRFSTVLITLGQLESPIRRVELFEYVKSIGGTFPVIRSPLSYVSAHAEVGEGTIIMHGAVVNAGAKIGKNCIINSKALVEHDAVVESNCHIATGAIVNGGVVIGYESFVGSGSVTRQAVSISPRSFIKAGSVVGKSL